MNAKRGRTLLSLAILAGGLLSATGCQTWVAGMTLPSPHYLEHQPQYFFPSPVFPLERELAQQEAVWSAPIPGEAAEVLPAPVAPAGPVAPVLPPPR